MKKSIVALAVVATFGLSGCSIFGSSSPNPAVTHTSIADQKIATDFTDEGIKIYYTWTGKLDRIEVFGQADVNKGNFNVIAEADAKAKLVKFVHGEQVNSNKYVRIISKAMDVAKDESATSSRSQDGVIETTDKELEAMPDNGNASNGETMRRAERVNGTLTNTVTTIVSRGKLTGVHKIRDEVRGDGKLYVAVYQWSKKDQDTSEYMRAQMR